MSQDKTAVFITSAPFFNEEDIMTKAELDVCLEELKTLTAFLDGHDIMVHEGATEEAFGFASALRDDPDMWVTPEARFEAMKAVRKHHRLLDYVYAQAHAGVVMEA
jgi:hypothetical protein